MLLQVIGQVLLQVIGRVLLGQVLLLVLLLWAMLLLGEMLVKLVVSLSEPFQSVSFVYHRLGPAVTFGPYSQSMAGY